MLKNIIKHFCLITRHKWEVFKLTVRLGIPLRGLLHDLSKYSPTEFWESVKHYDGSRSPINVCKEQHGYSKAWLHHKGRNKHHPEYWYDKNAPIPMPMMPYKYICEMICDQVAAGRVYQGKNWKPEYQLAYWNKHKAEFVVHEKIKDFITTVCEELAKQGLEKTFTKKNIRNIYEKTCL